jgi:hypothetical protein
VASKLTDTKITRRRFPLCMGAVSSDMIVLQGSDRTLSLRWIIAVLPGSFKSALPSSTEMASLRSSPSRQNDCHGSRDGLP